MIRCISRSLLVLALCLLPGPAWPQLELTAGIRNLAQDIQSRLALQPKACLAVVPFRMNGAPGNALETFLAEELIVAFADGGKVAIVEREVLSKILTEIRNNESGTIDQATAKKARLQGADYILTGTITDLPNYVAVYARVIDTETGLVSAPAQVKLLRDENVRKLLETPAAERMPPTSPAPTAPTDVRRDLQRLQQDNRELQKQANQLHAENRELRTKVGQLEARLRAQTKQEKPTDAAVRQSTTAPAAAPVPAATDEQALHAAEEILGKIEVTTGSSLGGAYISEKGAFQAWKALYAQSGEQAVPSLLSLLANPRREWQDQWKIITLLTYASNIPEGRERGNEIIAAAADWVLRGGYVGPAALGLIANAPAQPRLKWEALFTVLQQAPIDSVSGLLYRLPEFTPANERGRTAKVVADILSYASQSMSISAAIFALEALDARSELPRFREELLEAPVEKANSLAGLLAHFGDRDSVTVIRKAIEAWRHGAKSIRSLVSSLQKLEGSACYGYIAEILANSHPQNQREILSLMLYWSADPTLLAAVRRLAESTSDPEVREAAKQYLARHAPGVGPALSTVEPSSPTRPLSSPT